MQRVAVGISSSLDTVEAFEEAAEAARSGLAGPPDLCAMFAGPHHLARLDDALAEIHDRLGAAATIGCGAAGVLGPGREIEQGPGAVVWAAELPGAEIEPFGVVGELGDGPGELEGLPGAATRADAILALADPYRFPAQPLLTRLNGECPGTPVPGGLASAAVQGVAPLVLAGERAGGAVGAVGCVLRGVRLTPCVSQGAMPVGPEMAITAAEGNIVRELAFKPALERLGEVIAELPLEDREPLANGMLMGVVIDENQPEHERGDFLVRPIVGADRESGALALGESVRIGQTVRLHVRDGISAGADLREALAVQVDALGEAGAAGALMFTCNGRGRSMFGEGDHDATAFGAALEAPVGGFFAAGEIGPVAGRNFLHGFTATLAVFAT